MFLPKKNLQHPVVGVFIKPSLCVLYYHLTSLVFFPSFTSLPRDEKQLLCPLHVFKLEFHPLSTDDQKCTQDFLQKSHLCPVWSAAYWESCPGTEAHSCFLSRMVTLVAQHKKQPFPSSPSVFSAIYVLFCYCSLVKINKIISQKRLTPT